MKCFPIVYGQPLGELICMQELLSELYRYRSIMIDVGLL